MTDLVDISGEVTFSQERGRVRITHPSGALVELPWIDAIRVADTLLAEAVVAARDAGVAVDTVLKVVAAASLARREAGG